MLPIGETVCLLTAFLWAVSVTLFRAAIAQHGARAVNMAKCALGAALQGVTVLVIGQAGALALASPRDLALLAGSGVVGLALGDTALFASVARIGVHRTLLLQTLAPVFAAVLAALWQGEIPTGRQLAGAAVVLAGVALVVAPGRRRPDIVQSWSAAGVAAGTLAATGQGAGVVLAKAALDELPVVAASFVRLIVAALALLVIGTLTRRVDRLPALLRDPAALRHVIPAALLGTYLALFLMMAGVALAPAAIAAVLLATSPVFSLVIESVLTRRLPTVRGVAGTLLAVAGVAVLATV